jgi:acyl-CoA thioester hydrolase
MVILPAPPEGRFDGVRHFYPVRVYYEDTDAGGIVYHASYLRWFERARTDLIRLLGMDQRRALEAGEGFYAVTDLTIRYARPARLDDAVMLESTIISVGAASWRALQRALKGDDLLAEAQVRLGYVGAGGHARRQPPSWRRSLQSISIAERIR